MNLAILDGTINSMIERVRDPRRMRARFTIATGGGDVGVEVRGVGADRLCKEWEPGDGVHVRGRVTAAGYVAADSIKRIRAAAAAPSAGQIAWAMFAHGTGE